MVCLSLEVVDLWSLFQCSYGDFWVSSCLLIFPGIMSSLMFSSFGVKPPPLTFSLILAAASRLLHPNSTDDKTSRLMVKKKNLHSEGHPERFTELHQEEKREAGDRSGQEEKRGSKKGREQSNQ